MTENPNIQNNPNQAAGTGYTQPQDADYSTLLQELRTLFDAQHDVDAGVVTLPNGDTISEVEYNERLNTIAESSRVNYSVDSPELDPPETNGALPPGPAGTANPYLTPNVISFYFSFLFEILRIQSQIRLAEGQIAAENILEGAEAARQSAELQQDIGHQRALQHIARGANQLASGLTTLGISVYSIYHSERGSVQAAEKERDLQFRSNPNADPAKYEQLKNPNTANPTTDADGYPENIPALRDRLRATPQDNPAERANIQNRINQHETEANRVKPGYEDLDNFARGNDDVQNAFLDNLRTTQFDSHRDFNIGERAGQIAQVRSQFLQTLSGAIQSLASASGSFADAYYEQAIAELQSVQTLIQNLQQTADRAYQSARDSQSSAQQGFQDAIRFLEQVIQAETAAFGFQGGRIAG